MCRSVWRAVLIFAVLTPALSAQQRPPVRGTVVASDNADPVDGATIVVSGTRIGTLTNGAGQFALRVRGQRSISASSSPLVVIDGIPYHVPTGNAPRGIPCAVSCIVAT